MTDQPFTRLAGKEYSPLIIRRYSTPILHWVALITDDDLNKLDEYMREYWKGHSLDFVNIQDFRNIAGEISELLQQKFERTEGAAVIISADKMLISSLYGDFMVHEQCRIELYSLLNLSTQI